MELINDFTTSVRKALDEIDPAWESYDGLIVCGTHAPKDVDVTLEKIRQARESGRPVLGICMGLQLMAIEYARNVLGIKDATSEEFGQGTFVVRRNPQGLHVGMDKVGDRVESFWHNFSVDPSFFLGVQYHPEYQSSKDQPHPILKNFLHACKK